MSGHADGKIRLWETQVTSSLARGGKVSLWDRSAITEELPYKLVLHGEMTHTGIITALAYNSARTSSGSATASGSSDGSVFIFKSADDENPSKLYHPDSDETDTYKPRVYSVSYGSKEHKGATLASYADTVDNSNVITNRNIRLWANRDVNNDGELDRDDLVATRNYGDRFAINSSFYDVDDDGSFDIDDFVLIAEALDAQPAAQGAPLQAQNTAQPVALDSQKVLQILHDARQINADARVIAHLEALLKEATLHQTVAPPPAKTALFTNYPNPFNPETWIPYELATPAEVTVDIHSATGQLVRTLRLGHQPTGTYRTQTRAAYWDGRNTEGEPVASGVYFYTLKAGEFTCNTQNAHPEVAVARSVRLWLYRSTICMKFKK